MFFTATKVSGYLCDIRTYSFIPNFHPRNANNNSVALMTVVMNFRVPLRAGNIPVRFQVLTAASMKMTAFRGITPCRLVEADRHFTGVYYLHQQNDHPDDRGCKYLRNVVKFLPDYTCNIPEHRSLSSYSPP
jgi:hypothetical protein